MSHIIKFDCLLFLREKKVDRERDKERERDRKRRSATPKDSPPSKKRKPRSSSSSSSPSHNSSEQITTYDELNEQFACTWKGIVALKKTEYPLK